jgi:transketolase
MHTFGASAPLKQLLTRFGFTPDHVAELARDRVAAARRAQEADR